jgi:hypothetical protein
MLLDLSPHVPAGPVGKQVMFAGSSLRADPISTGFSYRWSGLQRLELLTSSGISAAADEQPDSVLLSSVALDSEAVRTYILTEIFLSHRQPRTGGATAMSDTSKPFASRKYFEIEGRRIFRSMVNRPM